jgi:superfamily I DNA/RNA helicase
MNQLPEAAFASSYGLNPQQQEAAEHVDGPLVIFAGAGSGKTSAVTHRCANLINLGVPAQEILLVTFTNKAANEMKERMARIVGKDRLKGLWAGTFHSVASRFLRVYAHEIGRRADFVIYDDRHQETVVRQIVDELELDKKTFQPKLLVERIQLAKQEAKTPDELLENDPSPDEIQFVDIWRRYENWLRSSNAMDFEDLILSGMRLAEADTDTGRALRSRFRYVMVDEFQDTNGTQYRMVRALASNGNLCVVGDDDQCHPAGTEVEVEAGKAIAIERLANGNKVRGWNQDAQSMVDGRAIKVAARPYEGAMFTVSVELTNDQGAFVRKVDVTPEHRFVARWACQPGAPPFEVQAVDLRPQVMWVPLPDGPGQWGTVVGVEPHAFSGLVYSLNVDKDHAYAVNGIVVRNCIYTWRGAKVENIRHFTTEFPGAKVVKLEQNYRSTGHVVGAALAVIAQSADRVPKELWTANEPGARVALIECEDDRLEGKFVADRVNKLMLAGNSLEDVAVLYRTHVQSRVIEEALRMWSIPYRIVGGFGFYDRKEIRDLMSYLRLIVNVDSDVDLLRVINEPARGIGAGTVGRLRDVATSLRVSLWSALPFARKAAEIRPKERESIGRFADMMQILTGDALGMRPSELALKVIFVTGYKASLQMEAKELERLGRKREAEEEDERAANCDELVEAIAYYERQTLDSGEIPSLRGYLEMVALMLEKDKEKADERLTMMTVHASKGLEFAHLFVVGVEDGHFPGKDASLEGLEEARRLLYVAMTRAKRQLWMTHCAQRMKYNEIVDCELSRFVLGKDPKTGQAQLLPSLVGLRLSEYEELERRAMHASAR